MSIRMLIDASHQEETRVAIVDGNQLADFDYESSAKKQLKGSIYLAKVTRVEPSLQAAFVDYGGNRHGFLAFSEIHPDYYQIPVADREALIAEEAAANADLLEEEEVEEAPKKRRRSRRRKKSDKGENLEASETEASENEADSVEGEQNDENVEVKDATNTSDDISDEEAPADDVATSEASEEAVEEKKPAKKRSPRGRKPKTKAVSTSDEVIIEGVNEEVAEGSDDVKSDEAPKVSDENDVDDNQEAQTEKKEKSENSDDDDNSDDNKEDDKKVARKEKENARSEEEEEERLRIRMAKRLRFKYKIQEVIKKNQIILVQVVKEERGNKGAALTTYLSLPGRYCVLMPNTLHGGGVSRKIANVKDRKKLKNVLSSLNMPKGHACIIRTAGADRTKAEIKRDYDYLKRMWEAIRQNTLKSIAPTQIYEEGNLIKRSIRDLYTRDISEIVVEGDRGYNTAKNFMQLLMPSHAKRVKNYEDAIPLFQRYQVENHLDAIYSPTAQLKSGGYIVINPTEALVSIDVNSGRATKEHNIEETALKTNLEAAEEVARQLKLRDMAGLVVIDFIDMEEPRNNRAVERKMKACLKNDRARIQVGRISSFGLMEMSRQRLRVGVLESSTDMCPHCDGSGLLRSVESQSLHILRIIEEEGIRAKNSMFTVYLPSRVAVYILNNKRTNLIELEQRYDFSVSIKIDDELTASAYRMDKSGKPSKTSQKRKDSLRLGRDVNKLIDVTEEDVSPDSNTKERPKRRRRRRRGQQDKRVNTNQDQNENSENLDTENKDDLENNQEKPKRRRRSRRRKQDPENRNQENENDEENSSNEEASVEAKQSDENISSDEKPKRRPRRTRKSAKPDQDEVISENTRSEEIKESDDGEEKPKRTRKPRGRKKADTDEAGKPDDKGDVSTSDEKEAKPKRAPRKRAARKKTEDTKPEQKPEATPVVTETPAAKDEPPKPKKTGWWSR